MGKMIQCICVKINVQFGVFPSVRTEWETALLDDILSITPVSNVLEAGLSSIQEIAAFDPNHSDEMLLLIEKRENAEVIKGCSCRNRPIEISFEAGALL